MGNAKLLAGFDDPEVMRAVSEVAANPASMSKYQKNAKVRAVPCCKVQPTPG